MLQSLGEDTSFENMYQQLEKAVSRGDVTFASAETKVSNFSQVKKLVHLVEASQRSGSDGRVGVQVMRAQSSECQCIGVRWRSLKSRGVYELLKGLQLVAGSRTWVSRWAIATRLPGYVKSDNDDMRWVSLHLSFLMQPESSPDGNWAA